MTKDELEQLAHFNPKDKLLRPRMTDHRLTLRLGTRQKGAMKSGGGISNWTIVEFGCVFIFGPLEKLECSTAAQNSHYYVRFIAHFVSVYERTAPQFARESARWSAKKKMQMLI